MKYLKKILVCVRVLIISVCVFRLGSSHSIPEAERSAHGLQRIHPSQ